MPAPGTATARPSPRWGWLRAQWFAPLASAAAVAVVFFVWNHREPSVAPGLLAQTYTPDPKVTASTYYSEEAGATVIDLHNLDAVPDDHEVRAFDVASAEPAEPGSPQVFYAANDDARPVLVLSRDGREAPRVSVVH